MVGFVSNNDMRPHPPANMRKVIVERFSQRFPAFVGNGVVSVRLLIVYVWNIDSYKIHYKCKFIILGI